MREEDAQLLDRYVQMEDQQAFAALVDRHLNVVYSAALRHMNGDPHQAREVMQTVFTDLARKAGSLSETLRGGRPLIGWLYTSTHFASTHIRRAEARRQARETAAFAMSEVLTPACREAEPDWEAIRPLLDEAMNALNPTDRDAVLLRYFSGGSLGRVGDALGISEEAARKRIDRALDRLKSWLIARGIQTTGAALAAGLGVHAVQTAPIGLSEELTRHALAVGAKNMAIVSAGHAPGLFRTAWPGWGIWAGSGVLILGLAGFGVTRWGAGKSGQAPVEVKVAIDAVRTAEPAKGIQFGGGSSHVTVGGTAARGDSLDIIRIPKELLRRIPGHSLDITNSETREFVLDDQYGRILGLTAAETERLVTTINGALREYRFEQGRNLIPVEEKVVDPLNDSSVGIVVVESMAFELHPFPKEAQRIRAKLETEIRKILGQERAGYFLQSSERMEGEMNTFQKEGAPTGLVAKSSPDIFLFRLTDRKPVPLVDVHRINNHGGYGYDYGAPLDSYAPESLKSVLARWREWISQHPSPSPTNETDAAVSEGAIRPILATTESSWTAGSILRERVLWDAGSPFVEIPKEVIQLLGIAGLAADEQLSPETVELCEMTSLEVDAVQSLYAGMRSRLIGIEQQHFKRDAKDRNRFVMEPFPEDIASLHREWRAKLVELLGEGRGGLVDQLIRTPTRNMRVLSQMRDDPPVDWLRPDSAGIEIEILTKPVQDGVAGKSVEYHSRSPEGTRGTFGPLRAGRIPKRWQHLLTSEILNSL
jgi:RNA polymerase sigma factor (sigma-70 family)